MDFEIVGSEMVATDNALGLVARVPIHQTAMALGYSEPEADEVCCYLGIEEVEIVGAFGSRLKKFGKKIKRGAKKATKKIKKVAKKVVKVAKKVAKNKLVKEAYASVKRMAPPPANLYLMAAEEGVKLAKAAARGSKKAKTAMRFVRAAAKKKVTPAQITAKASALRIKPAVLKGAVVTARAATSTNPAIRGALKVAREIEARAAKGDAALAPLAIEADLRKRYPKARSFSTKAPSGRVYTSVVVPA